MNLLVFESESNVESVFESHARAPGSRTLSFAIFIARTASEGLPSASSGHARLDCSLSALFSELSIARMRFCLLLIDGSCGDKGTRYW